MQVEGAQTHRTGLQIDISGTDGVLRIANGLAFQNKDDNAIEGMQGNATALSALPIPVEYQVLANQASTSAWKTLRISMRRTRATRERSHPKPAVQGCGATASPDRRDRQDISALPD
jgi:hypothetical protein